MKKLFSLLFLTMGVSSALVAQDIEVIDAKFKSTKNAEGKPQSKQIGAVNWTGQYIEATGESFFNTEKFKIPGQAESMAEQGAKAVAMANLLEITGDVKVTKTTTVQNMITENVTIKTEVEGIVRGAQVISTTKGANSVIVKMRLPLYGDGGLAEIFRKEDDNTADNTGGEGKEQKDKINTEGKGQEENNSDSSKIDLAGTTPETDPNKIMQKTVEDLAKASKENGNAAVPLLNIKQKDFIKNALSLIPSNLVNEKGEVIVDMEKAFRTTGLSMKYLRYTQNLLNQLKAAGVNTEKIDAIYKDGKIVIDESKLQKSGKVWSWVKKSSSAVLKFLPLLIGAI